MHSDFQDNFIRFHILKLGENQTLTADNFKNYFNSKAIKNVTDENIITQLKHLEEENYLREISTGEYEITNEGRKEGLEVKHAVKKFFD